MSNLTWQNLIESGLSAIKSKQVDLLQNDEYIQNTDWEKCIVLDKATTNITTITEYEKFDFQVS